MWINLWQATLETGYMTLVSATFTAFFGLLLGCILFLCRVNGPWEHPILYRALSLIVNIGRSIPYIILMCAIVPFTRLLVGTSIGTNAAIVSLTLAAIPFFARIVENSLLNLPTGLFELANALGAKPLEALRHIYLQDAMPDLIRGLSLTVVNLIGYSAMAGAVGGGGLGSLAIHEGYQRFDTLTMTLTVLVLIAMVQCVQSFGDWSVKRWFSL